MVQRRLGLVVPAHPTKIPDVYGPSVPGHVLTCQKVDMIPAFGHEMFGGVKFAESEAWVWGALVRGGAGWGH